MLRRKGFYFSLLHITCSSLDVLEVYGSFPVQRPFEERDKGFPPLATFEDLDEGFPPPLIKCSAIEETDEDNDEFLPLDVLEVHGSFPVQRQPPLVCFEERDKGFPPLATFEDLDEGFPPPLIKCSAIEETDEDNDEFLPEAVFAYSEPDADADAGRSIIETCVEEKATKENGDEIDEFYLEALFANYYERDADADETCATKDLKVDELRDDSRKRKRSHDEHDDTTGEKHGSRIISGLFKKLIIIAGDTRLVKNHPKIKGEHLLVSDNMSKVLYHKGAVAAYVGSELMWKEACTILKNDYVGKESNLMDLGGTIFEKLENMPLSVDNQGFEMIIAHHNDDGASMVLVVVNSRETERGKEDRGSGVSERVISSGTFFSLGVGYDTTDAFIKTSSRSNEAQVMSMVKKGVLFSALNFECIGGTIEVFVSRCGQKLTVVRVSVLELYLEMLKEKELDDEDRVILTFRRENDKHTSSQILEGVAGKKGEDCQFMGSLSDKNNGVRYFVNRVVCHTARIAQEVYANIDVFVPKDEWLGLRCLKIDNVCVFVSLASVELATKLIDEYKCTPTTIKGN